MIRCGWCGRAAEPSACGHCHRDPLLPWAQRGHDAPAIDANLERLAQAAADLRAEGIRPTVEHLAERLDVNPRTVRRWQQKSA